MASQVPALLRRVETTRVLRLAVGTQAALALLLGLSTRLTGLPFAFASHFAPDAMMRAINLYRQEFEPSEQLAEPHVILGYNICAADTEEEA